MAIRIVLIALIGMIGYFAFVKRRSMPVHILLIFALLLGISFLAVFPDTTSIVAHALGVGRGVDLITYLIEVGLLFVVLHYYSKFSELDQRVVVLTREIAYLRQEIAAGRSRGADQRDP